MSHPPASAAFLRVRDVAALLSVSPSFVRTLCAAGDLRTVRVGRALLIPSGAYAAYRDALTAQAAGPAGVALPVRGRPRQVSAP